MAKPKTYEFSIVKNYPESSHYEIQDVKPDLIHSLLEKLGLKKEAQ